MVKSNDNLKLRGTGVLALPAFIQSKFPDRFHEWLDSLPEESAAIHKSRLLAFELYSVRDALIVPTEKMCELFYGGNEHGAWESGHFSASYALNGIYKVFFRFGKPQFIIDRASRVFSTYYSEGTLRVAESSSNGCVLKLENFPTAYRVVEMNIAGWAKGALELMGKKDITVELTRRGTKGDAFTEYVVEWK
jgi:hypothetical protein